MKGVWIFAILALCGLVSATLVDEITLTVANSADSKDTKSMSVQNPNAFKSELSVGKNNKLTFDFHLKNKGAKVQQLFVRIHQGDQEFIAPSKLSSGSQQATFSVADLAQELSSSGVVDVEVVVGSNQPRENQIWKLGKLNVDLTGLNEKKPSVFLKKPTIEHKFRVAEKRPSGIVSSAFTLAVLSPILILLVGWPKVGANLRNFPKGAASLSAIGFHASLGAVLALFIIYWLSLSMMTTLIYMGILAVPSAIFAHSTLNAVAAQSHLKTD